MPVDCFPVIFNINVMLKTINKIFSENRVNEQSCRFHIDGVLQFS